MPAGILAIESIFLWSCRKLAGTSKALAFAQLTEELPVTDKSCWFYCWVHYVKVVRRPMISSVLSRRFPRLPASFNLVGNSQSSYRELSPVPEPG